MAQKQNKYKNLETNKQTHTRKRNSKPTNQPTKETSQQQQQQTPTKQKSIQKPPKEPTPHQKKLKKKKKSKPHTYFALSSLSRLISVNRKLTHIYTNTQNAASTIIQNGFHKHNVTFFKRQSTKELQKVNLE